MHHSVSAILMSSMVSFGVCRGNPIEHGMEWVKLFRSRGGYYKDKDTTNSDTVLVVTSRQHRRRPSLTGWTSHPSPPFPISWSGKPFCRLVAGSQEDRDTRRVHDLLRSAFNQQPPELLHPQPATLIFLPRLVNRSYGRVWMINGDFVDRIYSSCNSTTVDRPFSFSGMPSQRIGLSLTTCYRWSSASFVVL
jgi:hypothetical protein